MKIKNLGFSTFKIIGSDVSIITDPHATIESGLSLPKTEADICLVSDPKYVGTQGYLSETGLSTKIVSQKRSSVFEIVNNGEYEIGGLIVRRPAKSNVCIIDEGYLRVVYVGLVDGDFELDTLKHLGDVDVLMIPVGDGGIFPPIQKIEKAINIIDPSILIPWGYKTVGMKGEFEKLLELEAFLKECGFSNTIEEKELKINNAPEKEDKVMGVVILKD